MIGIQQRTITPYVNFNVNWQNYGDGFGIPGVSFWLGLNEMHRLTSLCPAQLQVNLTAANGDTAYANYLQFRVLSEDNKYQLRISGYSGTAGNGLDCLNGKKFSTLDNDNENLRFNRAYHVKGGWWHYGCGNSHPNGRINPNNQGNQYAYWGPLTGTRSVRSMQMNIRLRYDC